jgi:hypothetical protein
MLINQSRQSGIELNTSLSLSNVTGITTDALFYKSEEMLRPGDIRLEGFVIPIRFDQIIKKSIFEKKFKVLFINQVFTIYSEICKK